MKIAIFGRTQMLMETIKLILSQNEHEIVLIGTCKASPEYTVNEKDFEEVARRNKIPFFCDSRINSDEINQMISETKPDIGISMNWLTMIEKKTIEIFPYGILNAHPGDLPRYRGNACPNWAILNNETRIAITIHYMIDKQLDAGDIIVKDYYELNAEDNISTIYEYMEKKVPELFIDALNKITKERFCGLAQSDENKKILRCFPRKPEDSFILWDKSIYQIEKIVKSSTKPFLGAYTYYDKYRIRIHKCIIKEYDVDVLVVPGQVIGIDKLKNTIEVAASDGSVLIVESEIENEKMNITDLITSVRSRLNYSVQDMLYDLDKRLKILEEKYNERGDVS